MSNIGFWVFLLFLALDMLLVAFAKRPSAGEACWLAFRSRGRFSEAVRVLVVSAPQDILRLMASPELAWANLVECWMRPNVLNTSAYVLDALVALVTFD